jgi:hypothetical protein
MFALRSKSWGFPGTIKSLVMGSAIEAAAAHSRGRNSDKLHGLAPSGHPTLIYDKDTPAGRVATNCADFAQVQCSLLNTAAILFYFPVFFTSRPIALRQRND